MAPPHTTEGNFSCYYLGSDIRKTHLPKSEACPGKLGGVRWAGGCGVWAQQAEVGDGS